jgi:RHS repeat-associated protein
MESSEQWKNKMRNFRPFENRQVVAAIRDQAGNMGYTTNEIFLTVVTNAQFGYNAAGCITNIAHTGTGEYASSMTLGWDEKYQLTSAVQDSLFDIRYSYDVLGRRISRHVVPPSGGSTNAEHYVYSGNQVVADLDASGKVLRSYVWGPGIDNLLSMTVHGTTETNTYYALKDHQNSVLAFTDASGMIAESYEYDAWGRVLDMKDASGNSIANHQSAIGNRYLWQGREYDATTGLYYFRARWYDPVTGRWLSKDPIGISGGYNLYAFCGNNPVNFIDPSGLDVAYLNDSEGAGGAGHAAGAVGNDDSGWTYYSFAANNPFTSSDNLTVQTYDTYADMMNANPRYENSNVYPTDAASDAAANRAGNLYNGAPYDLLIQNCDDVASRILRDAGVNVNHSLTPNGTFKNQAAGCNK